MTMIFSSQGFLSTGDQHLAGNYGALDCIQALKWIRENIAEYGGDAEQVTIFGQFSGAAMAHLISLSSLANGTRF